MGFKNGAYATVWEVERQEKFTKVKLTTRRKISEGEYETDFSGLVFFIGEAHTGAAKLAQKSKIRLGEVDVTSKYDKEKQKQFTNFKCFKFTDASGSGYTSPASPATATDSNPIDSNPVEEDPNSPPF